MTQKQIVKGKDLLEDLQRDSCSTAASEDAEEEEEQPEQQLEQVRDQVEAEEEEEEEEEEEDDEDDGQSCRSSESILDLASSLQNQLSKFGHRLNDTRQRLEDTSRCYELLDKVIYSIRFIFLLFTFFRIDF